VFGQFSNKTKTDVGLLKADVQLATVRLDQCETDTTPFVQMTERRRVREETLCRGEGLTTMLSACCSSQGGEGKGHRRFLQLVEGCDALPATCSATCAPLFVEYFEGCRGVIDGLDPEERHGFDNLNANCQELQATSAAMLGDARPAKIFHVLVLPKTAAAARRQRGSCTAG
jgi:hypothetical protein